MKNVVFLERTPQILRFCADCLEGTGFAPADTCDDMQPALAYVSLDAPEGMRHLEELCAKGIKCVAMSEKGSVALAVEAMQRGACDFLLKPFSRSRFLQTLSHALQPASVEKTVALGRRPDFCGFIGTSAPMQEVYAAIRRVASSRAFVFITGDSGTGKELCAQAIHRLSPRRHKPFVALNCAAIPRELMESEIFGHVRGAFTGAIAERTGAAELADGGTLFLDEIAEMDLLLQAKLLRFLQTGSFQKIGSSRVQATDLRIVCATNRDPQEEVRQGRLRQDLYYRLHVVPLHMPPLCARGEDILALAQEFLRIFSAEEGKIFSGFDGDARGFLLGHDWPGNVRELQNLIRHAVVMNEGGLIAGTMMNLPKKYESMAQNVTEFPRVVPASSPAVQDIRPLWQVEKYVIESAIAHCAGNIPRAAARLEISPSTIYRKKAGWEMPGRGGKVLLESYGF